MAFNMLPLAYITAAWTGDKSDRERASEYCRLVYKAGFFPVCPVLYLPLFLNENHKSIMKIGRGLLRFSYALIACGDVADKTVKQDIGTAMRLGIMVITLEDILRATVRGHLKIP
jgi:hypothetical protein